MKARIGFGIKLLLVLALVLGFLFVIIAPQYSYSFNASLLDKAYRLRALEGPKLVLIGNSNLPFGVRSDLLEEAIGMPVVNMGMHGGLGNVFHEEMARLNVTEGDLYVVCHTEYNDVGDAFDPTLAWMTLENHVGLWPLIRADQVLPMLEGLPAYVRRAIDLWREGTGNQATEDAYSRLAMNAFGDSIYPRTMQQEGVIDFSQQEAPYVEQACLDRLNALNAYLTSRGARMVVAAYPIANGEYTPLVSEYDAFQEALEAGLDCPVISYFPEYMMDYGYFYDTLYHLTDDGTEMRTNLLLYDIEQYLQSVS